MLFKINVNNNLQKIREKPFSLEKEIQNISENNLDKIFKLKFVKSEFSLKNFRIDSLAFNEESKSFVIIEYKRDRNFSVIDQGFAYLSLMLDNKAEFILEYNSVFSTNLLKDDIEWTQSKVLFVSQGFTDYQKEAINFKDLPIELWQIKRFENETIEYEQFQKYKSQKSIKTISNKEDSTINNVVKEIKPYTESTHFNNPSDTIIELYESFKKSILDFGSINIKPNKKYNSFIGERHILDIEVQNKQLKIWLNMKINELDDPKELSRDVSKIGHLGNGDYELNVQDDKEFEYILSLIEQSINKNL